MMTVTQQTEDFQYQLLQLPKNVSDWTDEYISISGYFGKDGPHVFAAAPELLEALEGLVYAAHKNGGMDDSSELVDAEYIILKAKGQTP